MKKYLVFLTFLLFAFLFITPHNKVSAATFNQNNIIDDAIFNNTNSMSAAQINNFLNSMPNSCISPNSGFEAIDPTGYSPSGGFTYGGWTTAGQVIYDAANAYGLNPQVLLVTLEKEQSLVEGGSGICNASDQNQYAAAVGYGCPDSGTTYSYSGVNLYERNGVMVSNVGSTCVNSAVKAGFSQQVIRAAWLFKFGQERSEGNGNWAVINGNWDNSDDPQSCYDGPMTQGTFQICPGGPSTYYDGYTTIDGTSVHMDDGATAALYWYTPHLSGNENFFNIFSNWFGSTTYSQPVDSMFVVGNQSGKVYFISLDSDTRYYVPTWSIAQAFGLDKYQVMPLDDNVIDNYTNGGTLTTLVFNNDDQKVYLVDGNNKYWFQNYCTQWGLDCLNSTPGDVTFLTSTYFDDIINNGGNSQPMQFSNGVYYLMAAGSKEPFATSNDAAAAGYNNNQAIYIKQPDLNSTQPLGGLQIYLPTFIQFTPSTSLLYFDGQNYHYVPSYEIYQDWGSQKIMQPPTSTYNASPPTTVGNLSNWAEDGSGDYYLISGGRKINITSDPSNWNSGSFVTFSNSAVLNQLPTVAQEPNVSILGSIFVIQSGLLRHVPTYNDYLWLGIYPSNTLYLSTETADAIAQGVDILGDGAYFTVTGNAGLYVTNGANASYHIPSTQIASDFNMSWSSIRYSENPNVLSSGYPSSGDLTRWVIPSGGSLSYVSNQNLYSIGSSVASDWGINLNSTGGAINVDLALLYSLNRVSLGQFVRNEGTGGVYYGSGGTYHYISSYNEFLALGGNNQQLINVYPDFFTNLTQGTSLN